MLRPLLVLLTLVGLALAPGTLAFSSIPPGTSPHDDITGEGADRAGFPDGATEALQQAVREPDFQDSEYDPQLDEPGRTDTDDEYRPWHHCDRVAPATDGEALNETFAYIARQREAAANASAEGKTGDAVTHLGRALHALQDCYSHTDIVDRDAAAWAAHEQALLGNGSAVPGLRVVGYDPGADEPGRPDGDPYPHDGFAKDSAGMNGEAKAELPGGRTKFAAARELATNATAAFLDGFLAELPDGARLELLDATPEDAGLPDDVPVPGTSVPLLLAAIAVALARIARDRR